MKTKNMLYTNLAIMKKRVVIIAVLLSGIFSYADDLMESLAANPVLNDYASNITFYLSFNGSNPKPEMAQGSPNLKQKKEKMEFSKGLFGMALSSGRIQFSGKANIDLSKPGTIIMWVSPQNWVKASKEPYIIPFNGRRDTGYNLILGRQGGKWRRGRIYTYIYFPDKKKTYIPFYGQGSANKWKNGQWHMLSLSWDTTTIYLCVDDRKETSKMLLAPLGETFESFRLLVAPGQRPKLLIDEFVILNKKLSNKELIELYKKTIKQINNKTETKK